MNSLNNTPGPEALAYLIGERIFRIPEIDPEGPDGAVKSTQKVVILLPGAEADPKSPEGTMLDNMLKAIGLDRSGCRLVDAATPITFQRLERESNFELLLCFGVDPLQIGLTLEVESCSLLSYKRHRLLFCPPLHDLATDLSAKKRLWNSLKEAFSIK